MKLGRKKVANLEPMGISIVAEQNSNRQVPDGRIEIHTEHAEYSEQGLER